MVRSTRILHDNEEYLVQDKQAYSTSRTITLLARPDSVIVNETLNGRITEILRTNHGEWIPVAVWSKGGGIVSLIKENGEVAGRFQTILDRYLGAESKQKSTVQRKRYYYLEKAGRPLFSMVRSHPYGLAIVLCSSRKRALDKSGSEIGATVKRIDNLQDFLTKAADEGYAGAVLDNEEPVYFCLDPAEQMVFLKLRMNDNDEVEEFLLNEAGTWDDYEGTTELEFYLDQDRCDRNMMEHLGDIPFFGHSHIESVWTLEVAGKTGTTYQLKDDDNPFYGIAGAKVVVLFLDGQNAMDFIMERGLFQCEAVRVEDLKSFLTSARDRDWSVVLEPFNHRASSGMLWLNNEEVVLDSFSGFWIKGEGWSFTHA